MTSLEIIVKVADRLHPLIVHFPIVFLIAAFFSEMVFIFRKDAFWEKISSFNFIAGALFTIPTVLTGLAAGGKRGWKFDPHQIISMHRWLGISLTCFCLIGLSFFLKRNSNHEWRWIYRCMLLLCFVAVVLTAHYGGLKVYGADHFSLSGD
jgi:uncharacterized membrane protein